QVRCPPVPPRQPLARLRRALARREQTHRLRPPESPPPTARNPPSPVPPPAGPQRLRPWRLGRQAGGGGDQFTPGRHVAAEAVGVSPAPGGAQLEPGRGPLVFLGAEPLRAHAGDRPAWAAIDRPLPRGP